MVFLSRTLPGTDVHRQQVCWAGSVLGGFGAGRVRVLGGFGGGSLQNVIRCTELQSLQLA
jgi:hypothetical protein